MMITHYQFFSLVLEEDLNIPNRWNLYHPNIYPIKENKYVGYYKDFFNRNLKLNKVEVIYIMKSHPEERIRIEQFKKHLTDICFKNEVLSELLSKHEIQRCN